MAVNTFELVCNKSFSQDAYDMMGTERDKIRFLCQSIIIYRLNSSQYNVIVCSFCCRQKLMTVLVLGCSHEA